MNRVLLVLIAFAAGVAAGYLVGVGSPGGASDGAEAPGEGREILYYRDPMGGTDTSPVPKKDSMGMDYVPVYADEQGGFQGNVRIGSVVQNNLGLRTARVERGRLSARFDTVGFVEFDETRLSHVHVRVEGWIRKLEAGAVGEPVRAGETLFTLYSPALVSAQQEYVVALESGRRSLVDAAAQRLLLLDVPPFELERLRRERKASEWLPLVARHGGYVSRLDVREGMFVKPEMELMSIGDISRVWVVAELFERELGQISVGDPVEITSRSFPGRHWKGRVDYIYPTLDSTTRTARFRVELDNADEALKPNMIVDLKLALSSEADVLMIPRDALIRLGDGDRVVKRYGDGSFGSVAVSAGREYGEMVEVRDGLEEGETVVTAAQFLIDSESSIKAELKRLAEGPEDSTPPDPGAGEPVSGAASHAEHAHHPDAHAARGAGSDSVDGARHEEHAERDEASGRAGGAAREHANHH